MAFRHKIAIIGAGPVGISAARALKKHSIAYDQFEATSAVGGNWHHGVYDSAHIISSKKTTEFPDYPMPHDYPEFPSAAQMLAYLNEYVRHYELDKEIELECRVESVSPTSDGLWQVELARKNGQVSETRIYEGVIVCNGHHWQKRWPTYEGTFAGELIHSKDYRSSAQLADKRVLVIGGGNSACDIASEAARVGRSAHLSLRRGYWFLPKTFYGVPTAELLTTPLPVWMQRIYLSFLLNIVVGDYRKYGLQKPDHRIFDHHPTINTEVLHYLKHGKIKAQKDLKKFVDLEAEFVDGTKEEFDIVVCATGFDVSMPFLAPGLIETKGAVVKTQWAMVAPRHKQLYIYGWGQARYGFGPLLTPASELLARLILLQRKLNNPLGKILERLGQPLPQTHLLDPMATLNQIRAARATLWLLPLIDRLMPVKKQV
jgi:cation diffusion facilitator CzcD-associated flavoprotein CzcO